MIVFQSTRPVRGATVSKLIPEERVQISIHATRAGRDTRSRSKAWSNRNISIHAPRAGRDTRRAYVDMIYNDFNPRAPCGARLLAVELRTPSYDISIHAPRAGRDEQLLSH